MEISSQMLHPKEEDMKPLFATFRPKPIGQSLSQEIGVVDEPSLREGLRPAEEGSSIPDRALPAQSSDRAPYPTRLRVIIALALLSWAIVALIAWMILSD